jgi:hypothetical protein
LTTLKEIIHAFLDEIKAILREYMHETEANLKMRLKKLLFTSIVISILISLVISFLGSASLFILIGSLKYLMTLMPAWQAWYITGITSAVIGVLILLTLYIIIRNQLKAPQPSSPKKTECIISGGTND